MADLGERAAELLEPLIGYRTVNPGGDERVICDHLAGALRERGADEVRVVDVPRPTGRAAYVYARFGTPRLLVNAHVDTVPVNRGWTRDPFAATREGSQIFGLGTADTKGAVAAILTALERVAPRDVGVLFSGDEECGTRVMQAFLADADSTIERAIVCEPTARTAGIEHRGVLAQRARVRGAGGHSSGADRMPKPVVAMARIAVALDALGATYLDRGPAHMRGVCMNVAVLGGGVAFNVVPEEASLDWSLRPPPGFDRAEYDRALADIVRDAERSETSADAGAITVESSIDQPPFSCVDCGALEPLVGGHAAEFVTLDFWTEAALLSAAGIPAVVIGPGDIAQAHAPDEFVTVADLAWAADMFVDVFRATRG